MSNRFTDNSRLYTFRMTKQDDPEYQVMEAWIVEIMKRDSVSRAKAVYHIVMGLIRQYAEIKPTPSKTDLDLESLVSRLKHEITREILDELTQNSTLLNRTTEIANKRQNEDYDPSTIESLMADFADRD